ncbi:DoxX family protein [Olivibacter sitiensis]|uniref:DoxX family protein n=1 Tax=Olivibacter sitiensis TaxID=376470 RepID=UPI00048300C1|nr:DoxX family protein [Olivibacter sitiensis]
MAALSQLGNYKHTGLLVLRIGIGIMFIMHGLPKLIGGPEMWEKVGGAMSNFGIYFFHKGWGLIAAISETFGGFLMIVGLLFRPAMLLMAFTMFVATLVHLPQGLMAASQPIELGLVFLGLLFIGPGKYSVDKK